MEGPPVNVDPVLPGFFPDPSICRVGDDHYLIASSFEYFPGVPIFHSRDLTTWRQIGNVLDRPSQLTVASGLDGASKGIYAPTLRHHDGFFWMITTNLTTMDELRKGHLIVRAEDPAGPWSDPVHTSGAIGFDPDLSWDDEGTCHLTWALPGSIMHATVDPTTGKLLSEPGKLWSGTGLASPEGPHLFRRGDWWYLVVAEGGTGPGHGVSVARSRAATGPFEAHPANPILSHRSTDHPVQNTGHADFVELADGRWAMVHLGVRPRGAHPRWHVNGRETFITGVDWVDDWPVVVEDAFGGIAPDTSFADEFAGAALHPRWISPGTRPAGFATPRGPEGGVALRAGRAHGEREARHLLAVRTCDESWQAEATVPVGDAALVVRVDDAHWAAVERRGTVVSVRMVIGPLDQVLATASEVHSDRPLAVRAVPVPSGFAPRNPPDRLQLGYVDGDFHCVAEVDGRYLSTEVAGGFTGRVVGVEALGGDAVLTRFAYEALPVPR